MEPLSQATREIMWNISQAWIMYPLFLLCMVVFGFGVYQRIQFWKKGKADNERFSDLWRRSWFVIREVLLQKKVRQAQFPALFHSFFFYSFVILILTTGVIALDYDFGTSLFTGYLYVLLSVASELAGVLILFGLLLALWRRYVSKPTTLETTLLDLWALGSLALIVITGFAAEGIRIAMAGDNWASISFVGHGISFLFSGMDGSAGPALHAAVWWIHLILAFIWIATIPFTKFVHLLTLPANAFFSKMKPAGELDRVDLEALIESDDFDEDDFNIGLGTTEDFTWKQRLDLDACVSCGRCEEVCPAFMAGQPLSPKKFIANMKDLILTAEARGAETESGPEIIGNAFDQEFVWYCLTCMACTQACPAFIAHVDTLVEIRRNEVSMKGRADDDVARVIRSMEVQGNPFGSQIKRDEWVRSLDVPLLNEGDECDVLYWIGCLTTFDEDKQKIAADLVSLLKKCEIDFRVLGKAEACCGDPARTCGAENLFQETAKGQVEELNKRGFKRLLVSCPHCYNAFKNEYPQFGGRFEVVHHSELLLELLRAGKLQPQGESDETITYHDPCYLGRYQQIFDVPREVIGTVSNPAPVEMEGCREKSLCCGGGGGHFWMDSKGEERVNVLRVQQAERSGANTIATSCPYCFHMLQDALKIRNLEKEIRVKDIGGLLT